MRRRQDRRLPRERADGNLCFEGAPPTHSSAMTRPQPLSIGSARMMSSYNSRDRTSER
jgi:hypothetical protein